LVDFIVAGIDDFRVYGHVDFHVASQAYSWASCIDITVDGQSQHSWTLFIEITLMASVRAGLMFSVYIVVDGQPSCWASHHQHRRRLPGSLLGFVYISVDIVVDSQPPCWSSLDARQSSDVYGCQHPRWTGV
jgi:hypothetical protein